MKKYVLFFSFICLSFPSYATLQLRMDGENSIVLTADSTCEKAYYLESIKDSETPDSTDEDSFPPSDVEQQNNFSPNLPFLSAAAFELQNKDSWVNSTLDDDYDAMMGELVADLKMVNWKTGYNVTMRDLQLWDRIKMVCGAITSAMDVPEMMGTYAPLNKALDVIAPMEEGEDSTQRNARVINKATDKLVDAIEYSIMDAKFKKESRFTPEGLYFEIMTKHPFLLLTIDDKVYDALLRVEERILRETGKTENDKALGLLVKNMHTFFHIRNTLQNVNSDFNKNSRELEKIAKKGYKDGWSTFKVLADHSLIMLELARKGQLSVQSEKGRFLNLKRIFAKIAQDAEIHLLEEQAIRDNPAYKELVKNVDENHQHIIQLKEEALKNIKSKSDGDRELILRAYKKK